MPRGSVDINGEHITRQVLAEKSLDYIADAMADLPSESNAFGIFMAELERRKTEASIQAANAAKYSANSQAKSTKYMLWTLYAILATSSMQVVSSIILDFWGK